MPLDPWNEALAVEAVSYVHRMGNVAMLQAMGAADSDQIQGAIRSIVPLVQDWETTRRGWLTGGVSLPNGVEYTWDKWFAEGASFAQTFAEIGKVACDLSTFEVYFGGPARLTVEVAKVKAEQAITAVGETVKENLPQIAGLGALALILVGIGLFIALKANRVIG
jgi:hypothetical protein